MFSLDISLTNWLDFTQTIIPLAFMASESIAPSASWAIDSEPIRVLGITVIKDKRKKKLRISSACLTMPKIKVAPWTKTYG